MSEGSRPASELPLGYGVGARIAGYLIEEQVGQGGMAVVFRGYDERLERTVALKILAPALATDDAFRQRFIRESRAAAAVDDPHIIPVFEAGEAAGVLFIAMRFVRGGDVRSLIAGGALPPIERVARIVAQAASALDAAHSRGLVHRDVKPANMLLDARADADDRPDHVYLSDFGLTKWSAQTTGLTETGMVLGTLDYMAPEQIEGRAVDGRADQYALACAAFELLTGAPPFRRSDAMAVMYAQLSEQPPAVSEVRPHLPRTVDAVFGRALAKVPDERYRTCREFALAFRSALGLAEAADPPTIHPATQLAGLVTPQPIRYHQPVPPVQVAPRAHIAAPGQAAAAPARARSAPLLLVAASILIAGAVVGGAILFRSLSSGHSALRGPTSNASVPSVSDGGSARSDSASPPGSGPAGSGQAGSGPVNDGQAGYQMVGPLQPGAPGSITSVAWSPTGVVATSDKNGSTYLWNVIAGRDAGTFSGPGKAYAAAFSPDGTELAIGYSPGMSYLWNVRTGRLLARLDDPGSQVAKEVDALAFSPDGRTLATADGNGYTNLWRVPSGTAGASLIRSLPDPGGVGVYSVAFSSRGTLATGDYSGNVYLWDLASDVTTSSFALPGDTCSSGICPAISALAFSADGSLLAAGNKSGSAELWNIGRGTDQPIQVAAAALGHSIWALSFGGSAVLAMADEDGLSYLYRVSAAGPTSSLAGALSDPSAGDEGVGALGFSPSGSYLVTGDTNGSAYLWRRT